MSQALFYALVGVGLFVLGLYALIVYQHSLRKLLSINIMGSGVFLVLVSLAARTPGVPDPVPHAMVITGIVVAVSATALGLVVFMVVAVAMILLGGVLLEFPASFAGALILLIEAAATISIGVTLAALFLGRQPGQSVKKGDG